MWGISQYHYSLVDHQGFTLNLTTPVGAWPNGGVTLFQTEIMKVIEEEKTITYDQIAVWTTFLKPGIPQTVRALSGECHTSYTMNGDRLLMPEGQKPAQGMSFCLYWSILLIICNFDILLIIQIFALKTKITKIKIIV